MSIDRSITYGGVATQSETRQDWRTPPDLLEFLYKTYHINFDPCPYPKPEWDGLKRDWAINGQPSCVFINPPYGKNVAGWLDKACQEIKNGNVLVAILLLHVRTDNKWFHDIVLPKAYSIDFIRGRLKFVGTQGKNQSAPFPSMVVKMTKDSYERANSNGPIVGSLSNKSPFIMKRKWNLSFL